MELRDQVALEAMKVMMEGTYSRTLSAAQMETLRKQIPSFAYEYADGMMSARAGEQGDNVVGD